MERILKPVAGQGRRADKTLSELKKLQTDRIFAMDIHTELHFLDKKMDIPATFPMFEVRKSDLTKTNPGILAIRLMALLPEARDIMDNRTNPVQQQNPISKEDLQSFIQSVLPSNR